MKYGNIKDISQDSHKGSFKKRGNAIQVTKKKKLGPGGNIFEIFQLFSVTTTWLSIGGS